MAKITDRYKEITHLWDSDTGKVEISADELRALRDMHDREWRLQRLVSTNGIKVQPTNSVHSTKIRLVESGVGTTLNAEFSSDLETLEEITDIELERIIPKEETIPITLIRLFRDDKTSSLFEAVVDEKSLD